jgi:hypothetical protein
MLLSLNHPSVESGLVHILARCRSTPLTKVTLPSRHPVRIISAAMPVRKERPREVIPPEK